MKFDIYWHPDIYGMISKANTSTSRVRSYISKTNLIKYVGKTYDDTLDEEARLVPIGYSPAADEDAENQAISFSDIPAPTAETVDFWGPGYTPEVYFDLDRRYKNWTSGKEEMLDESSAALYKQVCLCELNIARNMAAGKPIEAAQKSMSELLGSLNVKPVQKKQDEILNESFDNLPFGVGIKMCENMRPIPKPDLRFDDVDGIARYISIWFLGHLCKMLGIRNTYRRCKQRDGKNYGEVCVRPYRPRNSLQHVQDCAQGRAVRKAERRRLDCDPVCRKSSVDQREVCKRRRVYRRYSKRAKGRGNLLWQRGNGAKGTEAGNG